MSSAQTKVLPDEFLREPSHFSNEPHIKITPSPHKLRFTQQPSETKLVHPPRKPADKSRTLQFRDRFEILNLIKLYRRSKNIQKVRRIHAEILRENVIAKDVRIATALITTYAHCGVLKEAVEIFEQLPVRDVVAWSALISGYAQNGLGDEALKCFEKMKHAGICADAVTYVCILKACAIVGSLEIGQEIDADIRKQGLLQKNIFLGNALLDMYCKCGALEKAREVFRLLPEQNVVSWSALISGYAQNGLGNEALECFREMQDKGIHPDAVTYVCVLKACGIVGSLEIGEAIAADARKRGFSFENAVLGTSLLDMYSKCGAPEKAQETFDNLSERSIVSWNALIAAYAQNGLGDEALKCFRQMQDANVRPDAVTYVCALKACGIVGSLDIGSDIHAEVEKQGLLLKNVVLGTALVDMYSKCGALNKAQKVFEKLPVKNSVCWNSLIAGYAQNGFGEEALNCYQRMQGAGVRPDVVTYVCILKACALVGSLDVGGDIDAVVRQQGLLQNNIMLGTALIDMYTKCAAWQEAREVFEELSEWNVVSWNAFIAGPAQLGNVKVVFNLYEKMKEEDVEPDLVTFLVLLNACSHSGLVKEGEKLFDEMCVAYHLMPTLKHYACMIDLYGRAGLFEKAKVLLDKVPHVQLLLSMLNACRKWRNVKLGRWAFEQLIQLDVRCAAAYVCMGNIYIAARMQTEAERNEALKMKNKAWSRCWWTDTNGNMHSFFDVTDHDHLQSMLVHAKLEEIHRRLLREGHSEGLRWISHSALDVEENVLCGHNEKFAIAFALINTHEGMPIHVTKNMRICGDCHSVISLVSVVEKRRIQVNAANRIHSFDNGRCICES